MDYLGFVITSNFLKNPQLGNDMAFHRICPFYGNLYISKHWELHGVSSTLDLRTSEGYGKFLCFPILFLYYVNSLFPYFGNCMDFCFTQSIWETHYFGMFVFSHTFPVLWEFTFPMFWKLYGFLLNLKCLCFPILFPHYGNPHFPCVGNCVDFCFK